MRLPTRNGPGAHADTELLSSYLDNQVTPEQRAAVERHVHTCAICQSELQSLRQTIALVHALPRVAVPRAFTLSEAQVGRVPGRTSIPWFGGLARVAGVLAALVVIAAATLMVLKNSPAQNVALAPAPAAAPQVATAPAGALPLPAARTGNQPALTAQAAPSFGEGQASPASEAAPASAVEQPSPAGETAPAVAAPPEAGAPAAPAAESGQRAAKASGPTPSAPPASAARPAAGSAPRVRPTESARAAASAAAQSAPAEAPASAAPTAEAPVAPPEAAAALAQGAAATSAADSSAPNAAAEAGVAAAPTSDEQGPQLMMGAGGAGGGEGGTATPVPVPPAAPISSALPAGAGVAYADGQSVWAIDRTLGQHKLTDQAGAIMPVVSPDRRLVAFWVTTDNGADLWVVGWDGAGARRLLASTELPADDLDQTNSRREFILHDLRWVPGTHVLAFRTYAAPLNEQALPKDELWNVDAGSGALERILDVGMNGALAYSPDGKWIALMQRGTTAEPRGSLSLYRADGSGKRNVLQLPANPDGAGYDGQLAWLPNSRSLWAGVANPDPDLAGQVKSVSLYRVPVDGAAEAAGEVEAPNAYWSPDGKRLAYTRPVNGTLENMELVLANADGSGGNVYATLHFGMLAGWAPDSRHFVYQDEGQVYLGAPAAAPELMTGLQNPMAVRWVKPVQALYLLDTADATVLVSRAVGDTPASLATLPPGISYDVIMGR